MFERTDATTGHDHGLGSRCGNRRQVNFTEVYRGLIVARSLLGWWNLNADMEFKTSVPDQPASSTVLRQINRQYEGFAPFAHWQDDPALFCADRLSRPFHRIEALRTPGISRFHFWMALAQFSGRCYSAKKGPGDLLHRL